jgi:hypothetical protein
LDHSESLFPADVVLKTDTAAYFLQLWWDTAHKLGFTEFLDAERLNRLEPVTEVVK